MEITDFADIIYDKGDDGVVTVSFNTPKRKNALTGLTFLELRWALEHFQGDDDAHAMILTGAPDPDSDDPTREAFSSGGFFSPDVYKDLPEEIMAQIDLGDFAQKASVLKFFQCDKPILAAINGLAIGGGFTLPLAVADQIYLSEHAWISLPFANLGISAELGSTFLLPRLLGFQKAKEVIFYPERIDAHKAVELGIANAVLPHDELLAHTREQALRLIPPRGAGTAIREMKRAMHAPHVQAISDALDLENEALGKLFRSTDFAEGITARVEKRTPVFTGN